MSNILIRSFDNTAFGVEYDRHGVKKMAYATKEVIITAGAIETPKLLMLSGIGPRTHLADLGVPVIADLPVGKNFQDHLAVLLGPFFVDPPRSFLIDRDITLKSFYEYKSDGNGPLSTSIFQGAAMISSKFAKATGVWNWPDILMLLSGVAGHKTFAKDMAHAFNMNAKIIKKYYHHAAGRDSFMIFVAVETSRKGGILRWRKRRWMHHQV
ncbi:L-sorbose 1-dehydrogenase [Orchesella cincta]|uniref:L-sorbose 1-dehydrogenase n=1 Tax=Orchesella cincta TaxID=48709 RepID=A0A1D2MPJ5_ORCCI|nr:L-sorbose 1-dehydrogenase [Orchesella cincta]